MNHAELYQSGKGSVNPVTRVATGTHENLSIIKEKKKIFYHSHPAASFKTHEIVKPRYQNTHCARAGKMSLGAGIALNSDVSSHYVSSQYASQSQRNVRSIYRTESTHKGVNYT